MMISTLIRVLFIMSITKNNQKSDKKTFYSRKNYVNYFTLYKFFSIIVIIIILSMFLFFSFAFVTFHIFSRVRVKIKSIGKEY